MVALPLHFVNWISLAQAEISLAKPTRSNIITNIASVGR